MSFPSSSHQLLQKTTQEVAVPLIHTKQLLRVRNQLRSPLLRLPTEVLVHILSFIMTDLGSFLYPRTWMPIYSTCHQIHSTMRTATGLWWKVDIAFDRAADFVFVRSGGGPQVLLSDLRSMEEEELFKIERLLDNWRDKLEFRGHRLHTLEFYGSLSNLSHFSWIFQRSLPRLQNLRINIVDSIEDSEVEPVPDPVPVELPMGTSLRVLDLRNVMLSWSSQAHLFSRLRELHLSFEDCERVVAIPEDELFNIFDAAPQLEDLSLLRVGHDVPVRDGSSFPLAKRTIRLPNLTSLSLANSPRVVKYTLAYMELPVIDFLSIRSPINSDIRRIPIDLFFPDGRLPARLFPNPPSFEVGSAILEGLYDTARVYIGGFILSLDFPPGHGDRGREAVAPYITRMAPPSITSLRLEDTDLEEGEWRDFFRSHPEVRSIHCRMLSDVFGSLWGALSPTGEDSGILCPMLESISIMLFTGHISFDPLADCLRNRQNFGFKLRDLEIRDWEKSWMGGDESQKQFFPLVETFKTNIRSKQGVSPV